MLTVTDRAQTPPPLLAEIARALDGLTLLEHVVRWGFASAPPRPLVDVVAQDEFTHDVVVAWDERLHLVFDTT